MKESSVPSSPFLYPAGQNEDVVAGAQVARWDFETEAWVEVVEQQERTQILDNQEAHTYSVLLISGYFRKG